MSRVLYVENGLHGGGSAESLLQLLKVLNTNKFPPIVVTTSNIPFVVEARRIGVPVIELNNWYFSRQNNSLRRCLSWMANVLVAYSSKLFPTLSFWLHQRFTSSLKQELQRIVRNYQISLVHTNNNVHRDIWAIEAVGELGIPVVAHLRSFHAFGFSQFRANIANKYVGVYVGYSRSISEFWIENGLDKKKIKIVPNAIGRVEVIGSSADELKGLLGTPTIAIIGRIIPERNHQFVIHAMPDLLKKLPNMKLLVVGDGIRNSLEKLRLLTEQLGVSRAVSFIGHRTDALQIIAAVDAIVLPYTIEPFGRTVLEAWMMGTPVLLSNIGHISDVVTDREDAVLFDLGDVRGFVDSVVEVVQNKELSKKLTTMGKVTCQEKYQIESYRRSIENIYTSLIVG